MKFEMIWNRVKTHNKIDLFKTHFKNMLIENKAFNQKKYDDFCYYFLKDSLTFNNETELRKHCEKMFEEYLNGILKI